MESDRALALRGPGAPGLVETRLGILFRDMPSLFLSHTWTPTPAFAPHDVVRIASRHLRDAGWDVWFDEDCMRRDVDASIRSGIDGCDVFVLFLTSAYITSVQESHDDVCRTRTNCYKEWCCACTLGKTILPVLLEDVWAQAARSVLCLYISNAFRVECWKDHGSIARDVTDVLKARYDVHPVRREAAFKNRKAKAAVEQLKV